MLDYFPRPHPNISLSLIGKNVRDGLAARLLSALCACSEAPFCFVLFFITCFQDSPCRFTRPKALHPYASILERKSPSSLHLSAPPTTQRRLRGSLPPSAARSFSPTRRSRCSRASDGDSRGGSGRLCPCGRRPAGAPLA